PFTTAPLIPVPCPLPLLWRQDAWDLHLRQRQPQTPIVRTRGYLLAEGEVGFILQFLPFELAKQVGVTFLEWRQPEQVAHSGFVVFVYHIALISAHLFAGAPLVGAVFP